MLQMDHRTYVIADLNHWRREIAFSCQTMTIEMNCPRDRPGSTPVALLIAFLRAMKLQLKDATQFVQDVVEEEEEEEDDE